MRRFSLLISFLLGLGLLAIVLATTAAADDTAQWDTGLAEPGDDANADRDDANWWVVVGAATAFVVVDGLVGLALTAVPRDRRRHFVSD